MHARNCQVPFPRLMRPLIAALAACAGCGAWAQETSPYYIGVTQTLTHDSNVFRVPDGPSDSYSSTGLVGGIDQTFSRQRVHATVDLRYNKYQDQSTLDNTSYGVNAGWDWATIENLAGRLNVNANQALASFNGNANRPIASRNILKTEQFSASVRWGGEGRLTLDGAYAHSRVRYSAPEFLSSQSSGDTVSIGATYRLSPDLRVGSALRFTRTVSPFAIPIVATPIGPDDYRSNTSNGRNLDFTADWRATARTGVNARLSWTKQDNNGAEDRNFSGLTGELAASYAPTAKLTFTAAAGREAGTNGSFFNIGSSTPGTTPNRGLSENSRTTDSVSLGAAYAVTAKIALNAGAQYSRSKLVDSFAAGNTTGSSERSDSARSVSLGATYAIARAWQLGCNLAHVARSASGTFAYSYTADIVGCTAQFTLR